MAQQKQRTPSSVGFFHLLKCARGQPASSVGPYCASAVNPPSALSQRRPTRAGRCRIRRSKWPHVRGRTLAQLFSAAAIELGRAAITVAWRNHAGRYWIQSATRFRSSVRYCLARGPSSRTTRRPASNCTPLTKRFCLDRSAGCDLRRGRDLRGFLGGRRLPIQPLRRGGSIHQISFPAPALEASSATAR